MVNKYRLEYREAGRRRWRVVWDVPCDDLCCPATGTYETAKTFRDRFAAEKWIERQEDRRSQAELLEWKPAPGKPQPRLADPTRPW